MTLKDYELKKDEIREVDWAMVQVQEELKELTSNIESPAANETDSAYPKAEDTNPRTKESTTESEDSTTNANDKSETVENSKSFYEIKEEKATLKMNVVKTYVKKLLDKVQDKEWREAWNHLKGDNPAAWFMAVQIALRNPALGGGNNGYNVWKIDGLLWKDTRAWVVAFQQANQLEADWFPGKNTLQKIYDILDGNAKAWKPWEVKAEDPEKKDEKEKSEVKQDDKTDVEDEVKENTSPINNEKYEYFQSEVNHIINELKQDWCNISFYPKQTINPKFLVYMYFNNWKSIQETFNFNDFINNGNLDINKLKNKIKIEVNNKEKEINEKTMDSKKMSIFIKNIQNKKYTVSDIFWEKYKPNDSMNSFFYAFHDSKLEIDSDSKFEDDSLILELDAIWKNSKRNWPTKWKIKKDKLKDRNWDYSERLLKKQLKVIIENIIKKF